MVKHNTFVLIMIFILSVSFCSCNNTAEMFANPLEMDANPLYKVSGQILIVSDDSLYVVVKNGCSLNNVNISKGEKIKVYYSDNTIFDVNDLVEIYFTNALSINNLTEIRAYDIQLLKIK